MSSGQPPFSEWLFSTSRALGYTTNTALAKALGVPQPTVSRWKTGSKPSVEHLVKISELLGVELKLLLVLSGYIAGEASSNSTLRPAIGRAENMIERSGLDGEMKKVFRDFWASRLSEETDRLAQLLDGAENAVTPVGDIRATELDPWLEKALESEINKHVQKLKEELVRVPPPVTWFVSGHPALGDPMKLFKNSIDTGDTVSPVIYYDEERYIPYVHAGERSWFARAEGFFFLDQATAALGGFFEIYPSLTARDLEVVNAPET